MASTQVPNYIAIPQLQSLEAFAGKITRYLEQLGSEIESGNLDATNQARVESKRTMLIELQEKFLSILPGRNTDTGAVADVNVIYHVYVQYVNYLKSFDMDTFDDGQKSARGYAWDIVRGSGISHLHF